MFFVYIYWRTYLEDLLPPGADGIYVILENTCDQQYTYQVDGVNSRFIGHGDLHDLQRQTVMPERVETVRHRS